jgi:hypothetical protein
MNLQDVRVRFRLGMRSMQQPRGARKKCSRREPDGTPQTFLKKIKIGVQPKMDAGLVE